MVRNFEIDESDQHALTYIESAEVFLSPVHILFSQNCWILKLEDKMQRILSSLQLSSKINASPNAPSDTFCGLVTIR